MLNMPAARVTDIHVCPMCPSGPILPPAALTVLVGNLPQARATDLCVCIPPPPFGPGDMIITGSPTVLVQSLPASRMTDLTAKAGVITTGYPTVLIGMMGLSFPDICAGLAALLMKLLGAVVDAAIEVVDGFDVAVFRNDWFKFLEVKWTPTAQRKGLLGRLGGKLEFTWMEFKGMGHVELPLIGGIGITGRHTAVPIVLSFEQGIVTGGGFDANAKIAASNSTGGIIFGSDPNNPANEMGVNFNFLQAEARGRSTVGDDGKSTGIIAHGKASADILSGDIYQEQNTFIDDDTTVRTQAKVSGALGSAPGGEFGGWGYHDQTTGRTHAGGIGTIKAGGGIGIGGDVSVGPKRDKRDDSWNW
ncbi:PAAR domain-containing protein [Vannielia litorea]|uniref:Zn-binding Pro-Ala-Ala-Arg (PAAR) domain-containing protein, incolved in TypeVI secretion n=1 Tax=Vannielia litorea TaxID=1217970 RepID=A0A1N6FTP0_9RHOB|nr:PAAR domain-containing protein [Vannielia litorea]SIN98600.1 Zn-binding Pro-Ala-Ala-Arg (PAAR) domain-containing protein, incolved in TypeVI secretion [Vannielia litorea]